MSDASDFTLFQARLERVEQRCKWLRREAWLWRTGFLCGVAAIVIIGVLNRHWFGTPPQHVVVSSLSINDSNGTQRVYVGPDSSGATYSVLLSTHEGSLRMAMAATHGGAAGIVIKDEKDKLRMRLRVDDHGQPVVELFDEQGRPVLWNPLIPPQIPIRP